LIEKTKTITLNSVYANVKNYATKYY